MIGYAPIWYKLGEDVDASGDFGVMTAGVLKRKWLGDDHTNKHD